MNEHHTGINARRVDGWVADGWEWGRPISHEDCLKARAGRKRPPKIALI